MECSHAISAYPVSTSNPASRSHASGEVDDGSSTQVPAAQAGDQDRVKEPAGRVKAGESILPPLPPFLPNKHGLRLRQYSAGMGLSPRRSLRPQLKQDPKRLGQAGRASKKQLGPNGRRDLQGPAGGRHAPSLCLIVPLQPVSQPLITPLSHLFTVCHSQQKEAL